jgi:hypothetical protein
MIDLEHGGAKRLFHRTSLTGIERVFRRIDFDVQIRTRAPRATTGAWGHARDPARIDGLFHLAGPDGSRLVIGDLQLNGRRAPGCGRPGWPFAE